MAKLNSIEDELRKKGVELRTSAFDYEWLEKLEEEKRKSEEEGKKKEEERISKIQCPSCKSVLKEHIVQRESNGVLGPGYSSWIVNEYFVCNECGTMYKDINKIK